MDRILGILLACLVARPVPACDTALLLAIDVSGSISLEEYTLQMDGLADALEDPRIVAALVGGQDRLALVHWSGMRHQRLALPWASMQSVRDVEAFAASVRQVKRPQIHTVTAIGHAVRFSLAAFGDVQDCARAVIDISGDGEENEGMILPQARAEAEAARVTLNAIAIEIDASALGLTGYFRQSVITQGGFVVTARGLADYPRAIRIKLLRELSKEVS